MTNKYYIKFGISNRKNAGSKAMRDVMHLLDEQGYLPMPALPTTAHKVVKLLVDIPLLVVVVLLLVRTRGSIIYTIPSNCLRIKILYLLRRLLGFRFICFINDIEQFRMPTSAQYAKAEMKSIAKADFILAPNKQSIEILRNQYHINKPMTAVGVWDYLSDFKPTELNLDDCKRIQSETSIAYAGNLRKSPFIYQLGAIPLHFNLWGEGVDKELPHNVHHQGAVMPDELTPLLGQCSWGLVWDGPFVETCDGQLGTYLRFNNAHKCGLYLASGIPLIVWKESGMAAFVESHHVGISINSLLELPLLLKSITPQQYHKLRQCTQKESLLIRSGHYFLQALRRAERKNLTLLWRRLQPMEAGKDVILVPKYLGKAIDYNTQVVCGYDEETIQDYSYECRKMIEFIKVPITSKTKYRAPIYIRYLLTHAKQIDLLMCFHHKFDSFLSILCYKCLNWKGKVYVKLDTEIGNEWDVTQKHNLTRWAHHMANFLFLHFSDYLSCETKQCYDRLTQRSNYRKQFLKKLVILTNAFDEELISKLKIKERSFKSKEQLMITVGRIGTEQKNTTMLLEALKKVKLGNWSVCLIGPIDPAFQGYIKEFFESYPNYRKTVLFVGPVYDKQELLEWYNKSKVFILTSIWESYGIVLTEAQRFRNYLISTNVGGASSLIQNGRYGEIIPQNDSDALSHSLQSIINNQTDIDVYNSMHTPTISYSEAIIPLVERIS